MLVLAKMKNDTLNLYHFERGYFTLRYRYNVFESIKGRGILIKNRFEEFKLDIDEYGRIAINPATFTKSINPSNLLNRWLTPYSIISGIIYYRKKQNLLENVLT